MRSVSPQCTCIPLSHCQFGYYIPFIVFAKSRKGLYICQKGWETANLRYRKTQNLILVDYNKLMAPDSMFESVLRTQY